MALSRSWSELAGTFRVHTGRRMRNTGTRYAFRRGAHREHGLRVFRQVHDQLSGSLHDHVLTFKADLDIVDGKRNSLAKHSFAPAEVE